MAVKDGHIDKGNARWYDADNTLSTAIKMLESCDVKTQKIITTYLSTWVNGRYRNWNQLSVNSTSLCR